MPLTGLNQTTITTVPLTGLNQTTITRQQTTGAPNGGALPYGWSVVEGEIEINGGIGYGPTLIVAQNTATITSTTGTMNIDTWNEWNQIYTLSWSGTSGATSCNQIHYGGWPFTATNVTTATAVNHYAWNVWNDRHERIREAGTRAQEIQRYSRRKLTEEELLAALEQEKIAREQAEKRAAEARMAEKRAEDLLRLCLSPQQIEDLEKKKCFYVEIEGPSFMKSGKKERYRIDRGSHGNVKQIDDKGSIIRSFCIQPSGVPAGDVLLTQKLWLEASEETREEFWATANITTLVREKDIPMTVPRRERRRYAELNGLLH